MTEKGERGKGKRNGNVRIYPFPFSLSRFPAVYASTSSFLCSLATFWVISGGDSAYP